MMLFSNYLPLTAFTLIAFTLTAFTLTILTSYFN